MCTRAFAAARKTWALCNTRSQNHILRVAIQIPPGFPHYIVSSPASSDADAPQRHRSRRGAQLPPPVPVPKEPPLCNHCRLSRLSTKIDIRRCPRRSQRWQVNAAELYCRTSRVCGVPSRTDHPRCALFSAAAFACTGTA
jgi:hypothetical protein